MKKKKKELKNNLIYINMMILGIILVLIDSYIFNSHLPEQNFFSLEFLKNLLILTFLYYLADLLQIIINETGHLITGLFSGYKFLSFRIKSFMIIKKKDNLEFKKYSLAGTAGQCLMAPPDMKNGNFPIKLYIFGGVIANLLSIPLALTLSYHFSSITRLSEFFFILAFDGLLLAIMNGLPIKTSMIINDGYQVLELNKDKDALFAAWIQLKVDEQITKGLRIKDMPKQWFYLPPEEKMNNSLIAVIAILYENRLMEEHKFSQALNLIDKLLNYDSIIDVHRQYLKCDKIYIKLIKNNLDSIDDIYDNTLQRYIKVMKNSLSAIRTEYTYNLLYKKI